MNHLISLFRVGWILLFSTALLTGCASGPLQFLAADEATEATEEASDSAEALPEPLKTSPDLVIQTPRKYRKIVLSKTRKRQSNDLWERIRQGQQLDIPDHPRMQSQLEWLAANPRYLERSARRARPYLHFIVEEAERRQLPLELALLPAVESGFRPQARSPLQAGGLWQFMPATARGLGLKSSQWYEERYDVTRSTVAALDYLEELLEQFDGDWELALAAYNAGPGTVQNALRKNRERGRSLDFWSLDLPDETLKYVPRVLAVADGVRNPEAYEIDLPAIPNRAHFAQVKLPGQIDLQEAARVGGVEMKELQLLNPGFHRGVTDPNGPHHLLVPAGKARGLSKRLAKLPPPKEPTDDTEKSKKELAANAAKHKVESGETLGGIALRYGVSVAQLKKANKLQDAGIRSGQTLAIPQGGTKKARSEKVAAATKRSHTAKHKIKEGETLGGIALHYGVSVAQLKQANKLEDAGIRSGRTLTIPGGSGEEPKGEKVAASSSKSPRTTKHKIEEGETLGGIALRYGISVAELKQSNKLEDANIRSGRTLTIPRGSGEKLATSRRKKGSNLLKVSGRAGKDKPVSYQVRSGDSLSVIAHRFGVSVKQLKGWNRLSDRPIRPGQKLTVYPTKPVTQTL